MNNYTILDASNDFVKLCNDIGKFEEELSKQLGIEATSQDFRLICLDSIQQYLLSLTAYIRPFCELRKRVTSNEFINVLDLGPELSTEEQIEKSRILYKFPIHSLVVMTHFQIDSFFGEVLKSKGITQRGFTGRMIGILDQINIDNEKREDYQNTLQCLTFFRNSFHNKGLHSIHKDKKKGKNGIEPKNGTIDRTFPFKCENSIIEFRHNEAIKYDYGWRSVYLLIRESVEVIKHIMKALYVNR